MQRRLALATLARLAALCVPLLVAAPGCLAPGSAEPPSFRIKRVFELEHPTAEEWANYLSAITNPDPTQPPLSPVPPKSFHPPSFPMAMNDLGSVCGVAYRYEADIRDTIAGNPKYVNVGRAFTYIDGEVTIIPVLQSLTPEPWNHAWAVDINNNNEVVGYTTEFPRTQFHWDGETLTTLGSDVYEVKAINDEGTILTYKGLYKDGAFVFQPPPADDIVEGFTLKFSGTDLANDGTFVGHYTHLDEGIRRVVTFKDGVRTVLPEQAKAAWAINDAGVVFLEWQVGDETVPALWSDGTVTPILTDKADLLAMRGWCGINDRASLTGSHVDSGLALYEDGKLYDVTTLISNLDEVPAFPTKYFSSVATNNRGDILAWAYSGWQSYYLEREIPAP